MNKLSWAALALTATLLGGCAHSVRFISEPEGADVYVDNIYVGQTPTVWQTRSGLPDTAYVRVEKEGFEPVKNAMIDKAYRADVHLLWLIPGFVPYFIGTARYEDDYVFRLKPTEEVRRSMETKPVPSATTTPAGAKREGTTKPASQPREEEPEAPTGGGSSER
ncbi:MAG: PEGA domain-containing protein [Planctomycetota bacterium]